MVLLPLGQPMTGLHIGATSPLRPSMGDRKKDQVWMKTTPNPSSIDCEDYQARLSGGKVGETLAVGSESPVNGRGKARSVRVDDAHPDGVAYKARDVVNPERLHQLAAVHLDRFHGETQLLRDLLRRVPFRDKL